MTPVLHRCPPTLPISSPSLLPFLPAWPPSSSGPQAPCILPEFSGGIASAHAHLEHCLTLAFVYNDRYYFYTQNKENILFGERTSLPLEFTIFQLASSAALSIRPSVCPQGELLPVLGSLRPLP